jgi:hypothetical protein
MKTLTFIGISGKISTRNNTSIVISKYSIQPYSPVIYFLFANGNERSESIDLNKMYRISDCESIYFKCHAECTITYELL